MVSGPELQQRAARKSELLLQRKQVQPGMDRRGSTNRVLWRDAVVRGIKQVHQSAGRQHVSWCQVHPKAGQIRRAPLTHAVCAVRKFLDNVEVVLSLVREPKPDPVTQQRPGEISSGRPVVE